MAEQIGKPSLINRVLNTCFRSQGCAHSSVFLQKKVRPQTNLIVEGFQSTQLLLGAWARVLEIHEHPISDTLQLFTAVMD